ERIHFVPIEQYVHFHNIAITIIQRMIVEGSVTASTTLQLVIKVENDLCEWQFKNQFYSCRCQVMLIDQNTTLSKTETHDVANVIRQGDDLRTDERLLNSVQSAGIRHLTGIVDNDRLFPI